MSQFTATELAAAFNAHNDRKVWVARPVTINNMNSVKYCHSTGLIELTYDAHDDTYYVSFSKVIAGWFDYTAAIARALHYVLLVQMKAGLIQQAPMKWENMVIIVQLREKRVSVKWDAPELIELEKPVDTENTGFIVQDSNTEDPAANPDGNDETEIEE